MSDLEDALGRVDGCPECVLNTEAPRSAVAVENGRRCAYLCSDCGHAWTTDWAAESAQPCGKHVTTTVEVPGQKWDNEASPRRCVNTVNPGALTDQITEGVIG